MNREKKTKPALWQSVTGAQPVRGPQNFRKVAAAHDDRQAGALNGRRFVFKRRRDFAETLAVRRARELDRMARGLRKVRPSTAARCKAAKSEREAYRREAHAFVAAAVGRGERCPVFAAFDMLTPAAQRFLTFCRAGSFKPDNLSEVHHKRGRRGALLRDQRHWVALSKWGHRLVHAFQVEARAHGWLCELGLWEVPDRSAV